jgi:hypothetical protein
MATDQYLYVSNFKSDARYVTQSAYSFFTHAAFDFPFSSLCHFFIPIGLQQLWSWDQTVQFVDNIRLISTFGLIYMYIVDMLNERGFYFLIDKLKANCGSRVLCRNTYELTRPGQ